MAIGDQDFLAALASGRAAIDRFNRRMPIMVWAERPLSPELLARKRREERLAMTPATGPMPTTGREIVVIEFKALTRFPRFHMEAGERWSMSYHRSTHDTTPEGQAYCDVETGSVAFALAGGQCLHSQVIEVYRGRDEWVARMVTDGMTVEQAQSMVADARHRDALPDDMTCPYCGDTGPMPAQDETLSPAKRHIYQRVGVACRPCADLSMARVACYVSKDAARRAVQAAYVGVLNSDHRKITLGYVATARDRAAAAGVDAILRSDRLAGTSGPTSPLCFVSECSDAAHLLVRDEEIMLMIEDSECEQNATMLFQEIEAARDTLRCRLKRYQAAAEAHREAVTVYRPETGLTAHDYLAIDVLAWQCDRELRAFVALSWVAMDLHFENDAVAMLRVLKRRALRKAGAPHPVSPAQLDAAQARLRVRADEEEAREKARTEPSNLPAGMTGVATRIWRGMEQQARGTLLVHGARSLDYLKDCGESVNACDVLGKMVEQGVLIPQRVDLAYADTLSLQYKNAKHIESSPWSVAHSLFWTYAPGNTTPMQGPWDDTPRHHAQAVGARSVQSRQRRGTVDPSEPKEDPRMATVQLNKERLIYARESTGLTLKQAQTEARKLVALGSPPHEKGQPGAPLKLLDLAKVESDGLCYALHAGALCILYKVRDGWLSDAGPMPATTMARLKDMLGK